MTGSVAVGLQSRWWPRDILPEKVTLKLSPRDAGVREEHPRQKEPRVQRPWARSWSVMVKGTVAGAASVLGSGREQRRLVEGLVPKAARGAGGGCEDGRDAIYL